MVNVLDTNCFKNWCRRQPNICGKAPFDLSAGASVMYYVDLNDSHGSTNPFSIVKI